MNKQFVGFAYHAAPCCAINDIYLSYFIKYFDHFIIYNVCRYRSRLRSCQLSIGLYEATEHSYDISETVSGSLPIDRGVSTSVNPTNHGVCSSRLRSFGEIQSLCQTSNEFRIDNSDRSWIRQLH